MRRCISRGPVGVSERHASDPNAELARWFAHRPFGGRLDEVTHGNGLTDWRAFDQDGRIVGYGTANGSTPLLHKVLGHTDDVNVTNVWDQLAAANDESYWYTPTGRLQNADGVWGALTLYYDGAGNRTYRTLTSGGSSSTDVTGVASNSNRVLDVTPTSGPVRTFAYDGAGNVTQDARATGTLVFAYNNAGRLTTATADGTVVGSYTYDAMGRLAQRVVAGGYPQNTVHLVYDAFGNLIAEADGTGTVIREYVWLPAGGGEALGEGTLYGTGGSALGSLIWRPLAAVSDADTSLPSVWSVHVDHLDRPVRMTDGSGATVWQAVWDPFGAATSVTGPASLDYRLPGQWFQAETSLVYNWHRQYDASLGRYLQPDPQGMPDGPNRYAYALNSPIMRTDPTGEQIAVPGFGPMPMPPIAIPGTPENDQWTQWAAGKIRQCFAAISNLGGDGPDDRCKEIIDDINEDIKILEKRYRELIADNKSLYIKETMGKRQGMEWPFGFLSSASDSSEE